MKYVYILILSFLLLTSCAKKATKQNEVKAPTLIEHTTSQDKEPEKEVAEEELTDIAHAIKIKAKFIEFTLGDAEHY
jgi:PBP1b-binding outer membrane lipoprotein LpoB